MNLLHHHHFFVHFRFRNRNPCLINQNHSHWCLGRGVSVSVSVLRRKSDSIPAAVPVPARDRVIDFGKYKGKMLGSVPSSYLKWVSNNLRAGHFEEWANLAEQVLRDPIYRDRIEWEFALNILTGDSSNNYLSSSLRPTSTAVSELLEEVSERFGWDNLDKVGWTKVDFDLLGTSKGGRIPRLVNLMDTQPKPKPKPKHHPPAALSLSGSAQWERRMERRERQKMRFRRTETEAEEAHQQKKKNKNINIIDGKDEIDGQKQNQNQNQNGIANPFPGRQTLLRSATRRP